MIKREKISVRLLEPFSDQQILEAWKISRPNELDPQASEIIKMDVPVNEFAHLTLAVRAPIFVREVICSLRNHIVWARSSRVDDLSEITIWNGCTQLEEAQIEELHSLLIFEQEVGAHQDGFRQHLPLGYMTEFTMKISFRDFIKLAISARKMEAGEVFFDFISKVVDILPSYAQNLIINSSYSQIEILPSVAAGKSGRMLGYVAVESVVPISLRAQIVRHRAIQVRDNMRLWADQMSAPISSMVRIQALMSENFALELIKKRNCWIAQTDLWAQFLEEIIVLLPTTLSLPCADGVCKFKRDNELRRMGRDPSPPCPTAARLEQKWMTEEQTEAAKKYSAARPHESFWIKEIENAKI